MKSFTDNNWKIFKFSQKKDFISTYLKKKPQTSRRVLYLVARMEFEVVRSTLDYVFTRNANLQISIWYCFRENIFFFSFKK